MNDKRRLWAKLQPVAIPKLVPLYTNSAAVDEGAERAPYIV